MDFMENLFSNDNDYFVVNIDKCIADKELPAVIRQIFTELKERDYISPGDFFKNLNETDLESLRILAEYTNPAADEYTEEQIDRGYEAMMMLGIGLSLGEGLELSESHCEKAMKGAIIYTSIEAMARKDIVEVYRENWSMSLDEDKPVVKRKGF